MRLDGLDWPSRHLMRPHLEAALSELGLLRQGPTVSEPAPSSTTWPLGSSDMFFLNFFLVNAPIEMYRS